MVVKEDGSKWACQSCLKGHRVSGCTHTDRELILVPKKGRPVTQCQHCRLERKKRSAHVKCDCGETDKPHHPREKCIHLREAEERAKTGLTDANAKEDEPAHLAAVAEEQGCCCHHGGKCTCSMIKKEPPTSDDSTPHGPAVQKPRLESARSDGSLTVFANGHHKPVHKRNHAAHESGMPYKMPMPRAHSNQGVASAARRSVDSLALDSNTPRNMAPASAQSYPIISTERRMSKSEHPSPRQSIFCDSTDGTFDPDTLSSSDLGTLGQMQTNQSIDASASDNTSFPPFEPMSGMTESSFDPWSVPTSSDSNLPNNNPFGVWATQFDNTNVAQPALTAASSGTQSEIDELPAVDDLYGCSMPSIQEDAATYEANSLMDDPSNPARRSLPPGFFGNVDFSMPSNTNDWQTPINNMQDIHNSKSRPAAVDQALGMNNVWNTSTIPSMNGAMPRSIPVTTNPNRPQSDSLGSAGAPNEDVIRQLFPDIDIDSNMFGTDDGSMEQPKFVRSGDLPTSMAMDIGPMDETTGFTSQPWSDGSVSIPNDAYATSYNLDQGYSDQDFDTTWAYQ